MLWDGRGQWDTRLDPGAWRMERDGRGWTMHLHGLDWEEPPGSDLVNTERQYLDNERRRVVYVAATRARDLLVIPRAGDPKPDKMICADLIAEAPEALVRQMAVYQAAAGAAWSNKIPAAPASTAPAASELYQDVTARWEAARPHAARPRLGPTSVSGETRRPSESEDSEVDPSLRKPREGRFGAAFGSVVHAAIGIVLRDQTVTPADAVERAAQRVGLTQRLEEARADVVRALETLTSEGLVSAVGSRLQLEYPIAGPRDESSLLNGYIDLVGVVDDRLDVIDFKTDAPPAAAVETAYTPYVSQVQTYARLLHLAGTTKERRVRCGLLFTADGVIRWVDSKVGNDSA